MRLHQLLVMTLLGLALAEAFMFETPKRAEGQKSLTTSKRSGREEPVFTREQGIDCILLYVDGLTKNVDRLGRTSYKFEGKNGCVNVTEISNAKDRYLTDFEKGLTDWVKSDEQILWDCDYDTTARNDKDNVNLRKGCITRQDMVDSVDTCIKDQDKRNLLKEKICDRAKNMNPKPQ
jgi:hypothetical protein